MGFFDKVTKAVGDAVDKGKKDVDQFMRIQKINGEISAIEAKVAELKTQIQQNSQEAGRKAIALVRAGRLASPDLQVFVDKLAAIEQQIAAEQAAIAAKKADIERIKAEHEAEHAAAAAAAPPGTGPGPGHGARCSGGADDSARRADGCGHGANGPAAAARAAGERRGPADPCRAAGAEAPARARSAGSR